jgi:hypothetical protein
MLGFDSEAAAKTAYLKQYDNPGFFGGLKKFPMNKFKQKILDRDNHGQLIKAVLGLGESRVPHFPIPAGTTHASVLENQVSKLNRHVLPKGGIPAAPPTTESHVAHAISTKGKAGILHRSHLAHLVKHTHEHFDRLLSNPSELSKLSHHDFKHADTVASNASFLAGMLGMHEREKKLNSIRHTMAKHHDSMMINEESSKLPKPAAANLGNLKVRASVHGSENLAGELVVGKNHDITHHALRHVFGRNADDLHGYLHQMFDPGHPEYSVNIHTIHVRHNLKHGRSNVTVSGKVHHGGREVGEFHRKFSRGSKNGGLKVNHELFVLRKKHQGSGVAKGMLRSSVKHYGDLGVKEINTHPAWIGRYTWARMGFNWDHHGAAQVRKTLPEFLVRRFKIDPSRARDIANRHAKNAWEVANLHIDGQPVGKKYLLSNSKYIEGPWDHSDARVKLDQKSPGYRHLKDYLNL